VVKGWLQELGRWQWMYLFLVGYGVVTEAVQFFIPGRGASIEDLVADCVGAALGVLWALRSAQHVSVENSSS
jgi:VanZ family protein